MSKGKVTVVVLPSEDSTPAQIMSAITVALVRMAHEFGYCDCEIGHAITLAIADEREQDEAAAPSPTVNAPGGAS